MSAVRYALKRNRSYVVDCVIEYIKDDKDKLTRSNKEVIERDIRRAIQDEPDMKQKQKWLDLIDFINN
jgi:formaldehyde-activating enzyme involved in methanogenesis